MRWIRDFAWFVFESYRFMEGQRDFAFWKKLIPVSISHANYMQEWNNLSHEQKEFWYCTTDRTIQI